ncbi:hypothetical protein AZH53_09750 [Methanomicrobiaceae archaeon CYW5]|uniref:hypothetical protein n=1 Tax=Methanovulcanius yangii TaxID=1789227 RepID=UPI0029CA6EC0|nr:hypothetical protein [Methanovulcanius yangii]MBT8508687.1 hypothetical protein [Methanovulcanius yangii]
MPTPRLPPDHKIPNLDGHTLGDFWSWAYSEVLTNTTRSIFAEYLVGAALGVVDTPRVEWDRQDFEYRGRGIEVKSSAYLQSWHQKQNSNIKFDIALKNRWDPATNSFNPDYPCRCADCYVFCLFAATDAEAADVLDISQWEFYVLSTPTIEERFGEQKSVALSRIKDICKPVHHTKLKQSIDAALGIE